MPRPPAQKPARQKKHPAVDWSARLAQNPDDVAALQALGRQALHHGQLETAARLLGRAQALEPQAATICLEYALTLLALRRRTEALAVLRRAVLANPADDHLALQLANTLKDCGHETRDRQFLLEAVPHYKTVLKRNPEHIEAYNNLGIVYQRLGLIKESEKCFVLALAKSPRTPELYNNLSLTFKLENKPEYSVACCRKALALRPNNPEALNNLGNAFKALDDLPAARAAYEQAIALRPDPDFRANLALVLLAMGELKEGFAAYEWRKQGAELKAAQPRFSQPPWQGESLAGKTLLIYGEQGFGDTIQFCRYASLAADRGATVVLFVPPALGRLLSSLRGVARLVTTKEDLPPFDYHCAMMSLPHLFRTELATIPAAPAYLAPDAREVAAWKQRLDAAPGEGCNVGLVWAGKARRTSAALRFVNTQRSLDPALLVPLLTVPGVRFLSLQKTGPCPPPELPLLDWMADCPDFAATAALVQNLDLVITVDTAVAHLTGALGRPVWVLNRFAGCWRWLRGRNDSPWYPSLRLFTQPTAGDWPDVIARVKTALEAVTRRRGEKEKAKMPPAAGRA